MKTITKKTKNLFGLAVVASLFLFSKCGKDPVPPTPPTIVETVVASADLSLLKFAVLRAGLATTLNSPNLTVFAPTDAAFAAAGYADTNAIKTIPIAALTSILSYHVLPSVIKSGDVPVGPNASVNSFLASNTIFTTRNTAGVFINGSAVTTADIIAANGVVHKINALLLPPSGNIVTTLVANNKYKLLVQAALKCGLDGALSGAGPLTLFAPDNAAFIAATFDSSTIANASPATIGVLTNVLKLHVFGGRAFSNDITNGGTIPTLFTPKTLTTTISGGMVTIKETTNTALTAANITAVNKVTTNGVIHDVSKVIMPL